MKTKLIWLNWDELDSIQKHYVFNNFSKPKNTKRSDARYGIREGSVIKAIYNFPIFNL